MTCVWNQTLKSTVGQEAILLALTPHPQDLTMDELVKTTGIDVANLESAIAILCRIHVAIASQGR